MNPDLGVPRLISRERVFELAVRELGLGRRAWDAEQRQIGLEHSLIARRGGDPLEPLADDDIGAIFYCAPLEGREDLGLQHVFTLLALVLDRNILALAYRALNTEDGMLKGTALEYLEVVLPEPVRHTLWTYLGAREHAREVRRKADEVGASLLASQARIDESLRLSLLKLRSGENK